MGSKFELHSNHLDTCFCQAKVNQEGKIFGRKVEEDILPV